MLDTIDRQSSQLVRLIDDLLDVSRITRGRIELRRERVDLAAVVGQAVESTRPLLDARAARLDVDCPRAGPRARRGPGAPRAGHRQPAQQRLQVHQPRGRVTLDADREGDAAVVRVRDTGIGIATDQLARIFEMFTQVDAPPWQAPGGLGIGLSLARSLVELHGGTIEARSDGPASGASSSCTCRRRRPPRPPSATRRRSTRRSSRGGGSSRWTTIATHSTRSRRCCA
jgi:signal transduction histidine kinase